MHRAQLCIRTRLIDGILLPRLHLDRHLRPLVLSGNAPEDTKAGRPSGAGSQQAKEKYALDRDKAAELSETGKSTNPS